MFPGGFPGGIALNHGFISGDMRAPLVDGMQPSMAVGQIIVQRAPDAAKAIWTFGRAIVTGYGIYTAIEMAGGSSVGGGTVWVGDVMVTMPPMIAGSPAASQILREGMEAGGAVYAKGRANPKDLERGMTPAQRHMFSDLIHEYKKYNHLPPNHNLPWEVLVMLADEAKRFAR